jgi:predicted enzyme related to lactoylglutathione lyase
MGSNGEAGPADGWPAYVVMDTQDPYGIAPFWCAVLGVEVLQDRDDGHVLGLAPSPNLPGSIALALQRVPEAKVGKNRVHFDVFVFDLAVATAQIEELGGRWAEPRVTLDDGGLISRIMQDPEGNEFCIVLSPSRGEAYRPDPDEVVVREAGRTA